MFLKIALIVSILCSAAVFALSELKLKPTLATLNEEKEKKAKDLEEMTKQKEKFAKESSDRQQKIDVAEQERDAEKAKADAAMKEVAVEKMNTTKAIADAAKAAAETASVKKTAEEFFASGFNMPQIKSMAAELPAVKTELDVTKEERKILAVRVNKLQGEVDSVKNVGKDVVLDSSIKGRIVAVDPKWDFVIVDVGGNHGVLKNGELIVNRAGKFVGRLKVSTVEPGHSIANIMQQWKKKGEEILEGDVVVVP